MKKAEYKIVTGEKGFKALEDKVSQMLNTGWKTIGGISFNSGFPYQAMARVVTVSVETPKARNEPVVKSEEPIAIPRGAIAAMKAVDELT